MTAWHLFIPIVIVLGAWSEDRFVHLAWAGAFFVVFLALAAGYRAIQSDKSIVVRHWLMATRPPNVGHVHALALALFVLFLGSWIPDLDWKFGIHRSPLTHSAIPYFIVGFLGNLWGFGNVRWNRLLLPLFGFALGSHLIIDFVQGGNLVGIPAHYEFAFYAINGLVVCAMSYITMRSQLRAASCQAVAADGYPASRRRGERSISSSARGAQRTAARDR